MSARFKMVWQNRLCATGEELTPSRVSHRSALAMPPSVCKGQIEMRVLSKLLHGPMRRGLKLTHENTRCDNFGRS